MPPPSSLGPPPSRAAGCSAARPSAASRSSGRSRAPSALHDAVAAGSRQGALPKRVDVVVVGGGIAGLVAARRTRARRARRSSCSRPATGSAAGCSTTTSTGRARTARPSRPAARSSARPRTTSPGSPSELKVPTFHEYDEGNSVYVSSTTGRIGVLRHRAAGPDHPARRGGAAQQDRRLSPREIDGRRAVDPPERRRVGRDDARRLDPRRIAAQRRGRREPDRVLDPARLRRRPRPSSRCSTCSGTSPAAGNEENVGTFARNSDTANGAQESRFVGGSQLIPLRLASAARRPRGAARAGRRGSSRSDGRVRRAQRSRRRRARGGWWSPCPPRWCSTSTWSPAADQRLQLLRATSTWAG